MATRSARRKGSRRLKLVSKMKERPSVNKATGCVTETRIWESGDDTTTMETTSNVLLTTEDTSGTEESRNGDTPVTTAKEAIRTSAMQTFETTIGKSTSQTHSLLKSKLKAGLCLSGEEENVAITTQPVCGRTEPSDAALCNTSSATVVRTKSTAKRKDPPSRKRVSWGRRLAAVLSCGLRDLLCNL